MSYLQTSSPFCWLCNNDNRQLRPPYGIDERSIRGVRSLYPCGGKKTWRLYFYFAQGQRGMHNCSNMTFDLFPLAKELVMILHVKNP
jgi:hypothetical protein